MTATALMPEPPDNDNQGAADSTIYKLSPWSTTLTYTGGYLDTWFQTGGNVQGSEVVLTSKDDALVALLTDEVGHLTADVARLTAERDEALTMLGRDQILRVEAESKLRRILDITREALHARPPTV